MRALPKKFEFSHQYALFLLDMMTDIIVQGEAAGIFANVTIKFKNKKQAEEFEKLDMTGGALCDWLIANGFETQWCVLQYKQLIVAVLSDMCHFFYEALSCSERGKLTVAYALLRKPLKQNLFVLECLLADPGSFVVGFHRRKITELMKEFEDKRKEIIKTAYGKMERKAGFNPDFIYELRYSPKAAHGFDIYWDKALHLVTNWDLKRTEDGNLNFIFSDDASRQSQWTHFYATLPYLLFYAFEIADSLLATLVKKQKVPLEYSLQKAAGFCLWTMESLGKTKKQSEKAIADMFGDLQKECPFCGKNLQFTKKVLQRMYMEAEAICPHCEKIVLPISKAKKELLKLQRAAKKAQGRKAKKK